jgi:hypothetical protein
VFVTHLLLLLLLILPCSVANEVDLMMSFAHPHVVCAYHFVTWKRRNAKEAAGGTDLDATVSASAPSCMLCNSLLVCRWFYCHETGGHMGPCSSCIPFAKQASVVRIDAAMHAFAGKVGLQSKLMTASTACSSPLPLRLPHLSLSPPVYAV